MRQGSHWINLFCTVVVFTEAGWLKKKLEAENTSNTLWISKLFLHTLEIRKWCWRMFCSFHCIPRPPHYIIWEKNRHVRRNRDCVIHIRPYPFDWISPSSLTVHCYNINQPPQHGLTIWRLFKATQSHLMSHGEIFPQFCRVDFFSKS